MTEKRFKHWFNEDGEDNISDNYNQFKTVDLCMPCGEQITDMLNELEREKWLGNIYLRLSVLFYYIL